MAESAAFWWLTHNAYTYAFKDTLEPGVLPNGSQVQYAAFKQA
jgi:peptide/nickel transport system substrate-binding protein